MKKKLFQGVLIFSIISPISAFAAGSALVNISPNLPGFSYNVSTAGPCGWVVDFYNFALIIAGILAFGAVVYGGIKYATSAGNASKQSEGRSWIWSALIGILLLGAAYLILNTVNPNLVKCSLPTLSGVAGSTGSTSGGATTSGGGILSSGNNGGSSTGSTLSSGVSGATNGLSANTINDLNDLSKNCGCNINVTSGVRTNVAQGTCTHGNGCKADIAPSTALNNYITSLQPAGTRGDGATLYKAPDGAIYANELTKPSNCGANCGWTGAHWDESSGN